MNFLKKAFGKKQSKESQLEREIIEKAKMKGRQRARETKLRKRVKYAEKKAFDKEMKGRFAGIGSGLKSAYDGAMKVSEACAGITEGFMREEKSKKRKRRKKKSEQTGNQEELWY